MMLNKFFEDSDDFEKRESIFHGIDPDGKDIGEYVDVVQGKQAGAEPEGSREPDGADVQAKESIFHGIDPKGKDVGEYLDALQDDADPTQGQVKITSFRLPAVIDSDAISDRDADLFIACIALTGNNYGDGDIPVQDVLSSKRLADSSKETFLKTLYASQKGKIILGMRSSRLQSDDYPNDLRGITEEKKQKLLEQHRLIPGGALLPAEIPLDFMVRAKSVSEKELGRYLRLVKKSGVPIDIPYKILASDELSEDEKDEYEDILTRALRGVPSGEVQRTIRTGVDAHNSNRYGKRYVMIVTCEDSRYPDEKQLGYFAADPAEGLLLDVVYGDSVDALMCGGRYEGLFHILYRVEDGKKLGKGWLTRENMEDELKEG